jgi:uncharacterized protein with HEPN domain
MLSETARNALFDMRDCIFLGREFSDGRTYEDFAASRLHFFAVTRALEIISEASKRLPDELRDRHPELRWRAMRDAGNMYRHRYDNVAENFVWKTLHEDLGPLLAVSRPRSMRSARRADRVQLRHAPWLSSIKGWSQWPGGPDRGTPEEHCRRFFLLHPASAVAIERIPRR